jgi:hypothetical protein
MRKQHRLIGAAVALASAGALAVTGLTAASASPAASGTEHFQIMTTSATSTKASLIAHGLVTAAGTDVEGNNVDTFKFAGGSFKVRHSAGKGPQHFSPVTCLLTVTQHGTYTIFGGTGKYAGIGGHGTYHLNILGVGARNAKGKCSMSAPPKAFQQVIDASGPAHR